ncbi:MAG: DNA-binding domain-containing protein [Rhodocyclales bacterium]|nr:DNA-binding domain-containing protein [Rhodocyclales bacterium]
MSGLAAFAEALLADDAICPPGLVTWNGSDPQKRFAVYRNNVIVGLVDALADSFPVTQALVGADFFRAMAREFVRRPPPRSPVLALYGEGFAGFIESFPPAATLLYLADVARLELLRVQAWHAADADAITQAQVAAVPTDPDGLPAAHLTLHPALFLLASAHAVVSLWAAHQADAVAEALAAVDPARAETALVCRKDLEVNIYRVDPGTAAFIGKLQQGQPFGAAMAQALQADDDFDPAATLALMLRTGAITDITIPTLMAPIHHPE